MFLSSVVFDYAHEITHNEGRWYGTRHMMRMRLTQLLLQ